MHGSNLAVFRTSFIAILVAGLCSSFSHAEASPMDAFGLDAPCVSRAMAVTASAPPTSAASTNPALLSTMAPDSTEMLVDLIVSDDALKINKSDAHLDTYVGYELEFATTIPIADWRDRLFIGATVHLPNDNLYHTHTPSPDEPVVYRYASEARHFSVDAALAVRIYESLTIGAGIHLVPTTSGTANISFANQAETSSTDVRVNRKVAPIIGIYAQPIDGLSLGIAYRGAIRFAMDIRADIFISEAIGAIHTQLKSYSFAEPHTLSIGARYDFSELAPSEFARFAANFDFQWSHYSFPLATSSQVWLYDENGIPVNEPLRDFPKFNEAFAVRTALDWMPIDELTVSLGYAYSNTPIPSQRGIFNILDADLHTIAFGAVYWLPENTLGSLDLGLSTAAKFDILARRQMEKFTYLPENPGFPSIEINGSAYTWHFSIMFRFK